MPQVFCSSPKFELSKKIRIGVFCGGNSSESQVSKRSGRAIYQGLKKAGYRPFFVDPARLNKLQRALKRMDLAFLALHGTGGEDGVIQELLERTGMPYTGSSPSACKNSFDKLKTKKLLLRSGLPTPEFKVINARDWKTKVMGLGLPAFIKPPCEGSSIGVYLIEDLKRDEPALRDHLKRYGTLLLEKKIKGREFTVGVLGETALPVIELKPSRVFYDYIAKYTKGQTRYEVPASIPDSLKMKLQKIALRTHRALKLRDMSRIDFMVDERGKPFILEANSIPGFTELSLLPKAAAAQGISFEDLCVRIASSAYLRGVSRGKKKKIK
jgi:D-alanine-D-alanine ligase